MLLPSYATHPWLAWLFLIPTALSAAITVDEVMSLRTITAVALSPDGTQVAYAVGSRQGSEIRIGSRKLTDGSAPAWSPDGKLLAFLRAGDVWTIPAAGGDALKLTSHPTSIRRFSWSPDGKYIAFTAQDVIPPADPTIFGLTGLPFVRLWLCDRAAQKTRQLTPGKYSVGGYDQWFPDGFSWSPDSRRITFSLRPDGRAGSHLYADLASVTLEGGEPEYLVRRDGMDANPHWSPKGDLVGFISTAKVDWITISNLFTVSPSTGKIRNLTSQFDESIKEFAWSGDGRSIFFIAGQGTADSVFSLDVPDGRVLRLTGDGNVYSHLSLSRDGGRAAFVRQNGITPPDVYIASTANFHSGQVSHINPQIQPSQIPATAPIRWRSFDGLQIEGMLVKPVGWQAGRRYPLLVIPHGGPHGVVPNSFFPFRNAWLMANRGWAVFEPNFRGSGNYGEHFLRANIDGWGAGDFRDIMTGVDHLIEIGIADPDRLAISGASYGGYMAAWSITQTNRFRAAIVGCAVTDLVSFMGTTDVRTRFETYLGTDPRRYVRLSPMEYVDRARTPSLIWHGDQDPRVPLTQGHELFSALKRQGVPVEFLIYHGEGHGLSMPSHQMDLMQREFAWLDRWVPEKVGGGNR